jgi:hypothetical protein
MNTERSAEPHARHTVNAQHRLLGTFIGRWHVTGQNAPSTPGGAAATVSGEESYEWLPGSFFVMNRWDRLFSDGNEHVGTGFLGSRGGAGFFSQSFDNLGYERRYEVTAEGRVWSFTGQFERARYEFSEDGDGFTARWELSRDGKDWQPLCDLRATRIGQPMPAVS